jgi:hypothetical protein
MCDWDQELKRILQRRKWDKCTVCGREIDRGDIAWNDACTDVGTPFSIVFIICQACDTSIARVQSWYPEIEDLEDVCYVLGDEDSDVY